jgi:hypothetical protein
MSDTDIHSCGYYCERHACIKTQRDELRNKLFSDQAVKTYSGGKPTYTQPIEHEFIDTTAKWGGDFVEVLNPLKENEILRVYHEPSKKEWVGLTEDEAQYLFRLCLGRTYDNFWQAIEAKLKEKNA